MRLRHAAVVMVVGVSATAPAFGQTSAASPSLICFGNEPNWSVAFSATDRAQVTTPGASATEYRGRETRLDALGESAWRGTRDGQAGDLVLLTRRASCSDGMSDMTHPIIARLSLADGSLFAGCCRVPAPQNDGSPLEGPTWLLTSLPGRTPAALAALPRRVSLRLSEGRATGFGGCNVLTGSYTTKGSSVTLALASTMMACSEPAAGIESAFLQALQRPLTHAITGDRLALTTESGAVLGFEREPEQTLTGHTWTVTQFNNGRQAVVSTLADTRLTLAFENGRVSGQAGCNTFTAPYSTDGDRLTIGPAAATRKMCAEPVMTQERQFLTALQSATRWAIEGGGLDMHSPNGERALSAIPSK